MLRAEERLVASIEMRQFGVNCYYVKLSVTECVPYFGALKWCIAEPKEDA
jgi:hypothetical protein